MAEKINYIELAEEANDSTEVAEASPDDVSTDADSDKDTLPDAPNADEMDAPLEAAPMDEEMGQEETPEGAAHPKKKKKKSFQQRFDKMTWERAQEKKEYLARIEVLELDKRAREETDSRQKASEKVSSLEKEAAAAMDEGEHAKAASINTEIARAVANNPGPSNVANDFDAVEYFKSKNPWYGQDELMTMAAQGNEAEIFNEKNTAYAHLSKKEKYDLVAKRTMSAKKVNPYKAASLTAPASSIPAATQNTITSEEIRATKLIYGDLKTKEEIIKRAKELKTIQMEQNNGY